MIDLSFVRTAIYDHTAKGLLTDEDERNLEQAIADAPSVHPVITKAGGIRKIRVAIKGRGKSGGARVLYLYVPAKSRVYLIVAYAKNVKATISNEEKKRLKALATRLKGE